jgi:hypothetical protein
VGGALGVQHVRGLAAGQQREHDLRVQRVLQVRLGLLRCAEPLLDVGDARVGDRVALAVRSGAGLDARLLHESVAQQPGQRRVHLPVVQGSVLAELVVVGLLQVVAVAGAAFQQTEKGVSE